MRYGRYEILKELGKGSMGMVFQAHDPQIDRLVAIKVLRQDRLSSEAFVQRFLKEAKTIGRLSHANIVTVYDVGEDQGTIYIAMEFLEGVPLDKLLTPERKFTIPEIADVGVQIAEALQYAHDRGVIHRDIKPSNIIVQSGGRIKITDFGIAHIEDPAEAVQTQAGEILGTPAYMSPEQVLGKTVDGRSDLFSLGIILWELSTGRRPFRGENMAAVFRAVTFENPEAPDKINAAVPSALSDIILKCLEKDPGKRFESGKILADTLKKIPGDAHETIHNRRKVSPQPKPYRSLLIGLAVLGGVAAGGLFYYGENPRPTVQPAPPPAVEKVKAAFLRVESTPGGAQIFIDGNFRGKTPGRLEVAAAKHEVRLVLAGYYDWEAQVEPPENSEFPLIVKLTAASEKK